MWDEMALSGVMLLGMMVLLALPVVLKQSTARVPFGLLLRVAAVQMMALGGVALMSARPQKEEAQMLLAAVAGPV